MKKLKVKYPAGLYVTGYDDDYLTFIMITDKGSFHLVSPPDNQDRRWERLDIKMFMYLTKTFGDLTPIRQIPFFVN